MTDAGSVAFGGVGVYVDKRPAQFGIVYLERGKCRTGKVATVRQQNPNGWHPAKCNRSLMRLPDTGT